MSEQYTIRISYADETVSSKMADGTDKLVKNTNDINRTLTRLETVNKRATTYAVQGSVDQRNILASGIAGGLEFAGGFASGRKTAHALLGKQSDKILKESIFKNIKIDRIKRTIVSTTKKGASSLKSSYKTMVNKATSRAKAFASKLRNSSVSEQEKALQRALDEASYRNARTVDFREIRPNAPIVRRTSTDPGTGRFFFKNSTELTNRAQEINIEKKLNTKDDFVLQQEIKRQKEIEKEELFTYIDATQALDRERVRNIEEQRQSQANQNAITRRMFKKPESQVEKMLRHANIMSMKQDIDLSNVKGYPMDNLISSKTGALERNENRIETKTFTNAEIKRNVELMAQEKRERRLQFERVRKQLSFDKRVQNDQLKEQRTNRRLDKAQENLNRKLDKVKSRKNVKTKPLETADPVEAANKIDSLKRLGISKPQISPLEPRILEAMSTRSLSAVFGSFPAEDITQMILKHGIKKSLVKSQDMLDKGYEFKFKYDNNGGLP